MQLPVWMIGKYYDVIYVYKDEFSHLMMEVYNMDGNTPVFMGVQPCSYDLNTLEELPSPKKEMMERKRNRRVQSVRNVY